VIEPAAIPAAPPAPAAAVPHVVAWNLTRRCNLRCAHCYLDAGPDASTEGQLTTEECLRIADEVLGVPTAAHESVAAALAAAMSSGEPVLVTGSVYVAGEARDALGL